ncbi:hypothetical protein JCM10207_001478 [Rhodosporidiobolus poonsookiae]
MKNCGPNAFVVFCPPHVPIRHRSPSSPADSAPPASRFQSPLGLVRYCFYGGNLSWGTNNDTLRDAFQQFGQIVDCIVMTEPGTGRSRGFGFVTFADQSSADNAIQAMNDQELYNPHTEDETAVQGPGLPLDFEHRVPGLAVSGTPESFSDADVASLSGKRGYAFCSFFSPFKARLTLATLDGRRLRVNIANQRTGGGGGGGYGGGGYGGGGYGGGQGGYGGGYGGQSGGYGGYGGAQSGGYGGYGQQAQGGYGGAQGGYGGDASGGYGAGAPYGGQSGGYGQQGGQGGYGGQQGGQGGYGGGY